MQLQKSRLAKELTGKRADWLKTRLEVEALKITARLPAAVANLLHVFAELQGKGCQWKVRVCCCKCGSARSGMTPAEWGSVGLTNTTRQWFDVYGTFMILNKEVTM